MRGQHARPRSMRLGWRITRGEPCEYQWQQDAVQCQTAITVVNEGIQVVIRAVWAVAVSLGGTQPRMTLRSGMTSGFCRNVLS
mmetsp:Transcript_47512/g.77137  ORF Transcript_47512/g.77137 Transcript_47512/m.77137 type:complete len:83 (-) Transcript_47512:56-304(-)